MNQEAWADEGLSRMAEEEDVRRASIFSAAEGASMEVTEVRVFPVEEERLKGYATITLDHCFLVRDLKVILGNKGLFVAMPSKKRKDGTYQDIAHPLNSQTRRMIEDKVLSEYQRVAEIPQQAPETA